MEITSDVIIAIAVFLVAFIFTMKVMKSAVKFVLIAAVIYVAYLVLQGYM